MKIVFETMSDTVLANFCGGEKEFCAKMYIDEKGKILRGKLVPGASIGLHTHDTSSEMIYYLSGCGKVICDGEEERVAAGDCHYCPKGSAHTMINDGEEDLVFFAVVPLQ